jgi:HPt (histidine-containing phosphotransfer) domain-containing protein
MDLASPGTDVGRIPHSRLYSAASIAGALFAAAALAFLWVAARPAVAAPFVWLSLAAGLGGLGLLVASLILPARLLRRRLFARLDSVENQNSTLWQKTLDLEANKREMDTILHSLRAHLMLIDSSYLIASRYSSELESVFNQKNLGNENLLNLLQRLLSERMFKTARDYLVLLFDGSKRERTVLKVNPLDEVEINAAGPDGSVTVRYLKFSFRRIVENARVSRVLVSVEDVTEATLRERQLRESEQAKVKQFEMLIGILHVQPHDIDGFMTLAREQLATVDEALKVSDFTAATVAQTGLLRQRLDVVLQRVHNIKGNASLLRLEFFENEAQRFEQRIIDLKHRPALGGDDFLNLVIGLADFRADLDALQSLRVKLASIQRTAQSRQEIGDDLIVSIEDLAKTLAKKLGKEVKVEAEGFDSRKLPQALRLVVKDALIQLTRNSLAHGVETPDTRVAIGKPRVATISIQPLAGLAAGEFGFTFRDDGRGLDAEQIRERAVALQLLEADQASSVPDSAIAGFIFAPGFSTAKVATIDAGRGMGMNVIKSRIVDDCGGEIGVDSEAGQFCEFTFVLPLPAAALAS